MGLSPVQLVVVVIILRQSLVIKDGSRRVGFIYIKQISLDESKLLN